MIKREKLQEQVKISLTELEVVSLMEGAAALQSLIGNPLTEFPFGNTILKILLETSKLKPKWCFNREEILGAFDVSSH